MNFETWFKGQFQKGLLYGSDEEVAETAWKAGQEALRPHLANLHPVASEQTADLAAPRNEAAADEQRVAFERAYRARYPNAISLTTDKFELDEFEEYKHATVEIGWQMWQARAAVPPATDAAPALHAGGSDVRTLLEQALYFTENVPHDLNARLRRSKFIAEVKRVLATTTPATRTAADCAHDYVRSDSICTECGIAADAVRVCAITDVECSRGCGSKCALDEVAADGASEYRKGFKQGYAEGRAEAQIDAADGVQGEPTYDELECLASACGLWGVREAAVAYAREVFKLAAPAASPVASADEAVAYTRQAALEYLREHPTRYVTITGSFTGEDIVPLYTRPPIENNERSSGLTVAQRVLDWMGRHQTILKQEAFDELVGMVASNEREVVTDEQIGNLWTEVVGRPFVVGSAAHSFARVLLKQNGDTQP